MNTKFKIGDKVIYKNKLGYIDIIVITNKGIYYQLFYVNDDSEKEYEYGIEEYQLKKYKPILDSVEKRYLENLIRPFRNINIYISKTKFNNKEEFLHIMFNERYNNISLPNFSKNTMYKGMELGKKYSIKELDLFAKEND